MSSRAAAETWKDRFSERRAPILSPKHEKPPFFLEATCELRLVGYDIRDEKRLRRCSAS
jgi:hypothetical protein